MPANVSSNSSTKSQSTRTRRKYVAKEFKVVALRECPLPQSLQYCGTPNDAAAYWRLHVATNPYFNPEIECTAVLFLNRRNRVKGHQLLTLGTMNSALVHPREVFRAAIISSAAHVVLMHNHPSGDPSPSNADIQVTRELVSAGKILGVDFLDHIIIGQPNHASLRDMGICNI